MQIIHVSVHVREKDIESFKRATIENASKSLKEKGILNFDVLQQSDDPARFLLIEIYRTPDDSSKHKETDHYKKWRDTVESMMVRPRMSTRYNSVFPE